jgi:hypothetical protein
MAAPPGPVTVKLDVLIVAGFIAMLKVAVMVVLMTTLVAPEAGVVNTTAGTLTTS